MVYYPPGTWTVGGKQVQGGSKASVAGFNNPGVQLAAQENNTTTSGKSFSGTALNVSPGQVAAHAQQLNLYNSGVSSRPGHAGPPKSAGQVILESRSKLGVDAPLTSALPIARANYQTLSNERTLNTTPTAVGQLSVFPGLGKCQAAKPVYPWTPGGAGLKEQVGFQVARAGGPLNYFVARPVNWLASTGFRVVTDIAYMPVTGANYVYGWLSGKGYSPSDVSSFWGGATNIAFVGAAGSRFKFMRGLASGAAVVQAGAAGVQAVRYPVPENVAGFGLSSLMAGGLLYSPIKNAYVNYKFKQNVNMFLAKNSGDQGFAMEKPIYFQMGDKAVDLSYLRATRSVPHNVRARAPSQFTLKGQLISDFSVRKVNADAGVPSAFFSGGLEAQTSYYLKGSLESGKAGFKPTEQLRLNYKWSDAFFAFFQMGKKGQLSLTQQKLLSLTQQKLSSFGFPDYSYSLKLAADSSATVVSRSVGRPVFAFGISPVLAHASMVQQSSKAVYGSSLISDSVSRRSRFKVPQVEAGFSVAQGLTSLTVNKQRQGSATVAALSFVSPSVSVPVVPVIVPPKRGQDPLSSLGLGNAVFVPKGLGGFGFGKVFKWEYSPSLSALGMGVTGKMPSLNAIRSGLVLRPIVK